MEDTDISQATLVTEFGEEIGLLVNGVTKFSRIDFQSKEDAQVENLRKMFLAMAQRY